ncbi:DUF4333 domain-containing protein [Mycobacterium sp. NPDC003449]
MRKVLAAAILVAAGLLGACSSGADEPGGVAKDKLASEVKTQLEAQVGSKADSVTCDGNLEAKVGATQKCELTAEGAKLGVTVKATAVDGDNVKFDAKVDDEPMP